MIDLGTVRPGSTIRIPFSSFDKDDGSSITMTNYAAADILVYKDGGTTERASTAGFTATTDFDTKTGKHLAVIDLADNTTAGFWNAGSEYLVAIDAVTVDAVTTGGWIGRFRIGYPGAYMDTTIATLASQTSFTLTAGPAEDDALNGMVLIIHDIASAVQATRVVVEDYTGSTKTVTLRAAPATTFTVAAGDNVSAVGFDTVNVTHAAGTAWGSGAITAASIADGAIDLATFAADAKALFGVIAFGTAQSVTGTTIQLASAETFADDELIGATVLIRSATTGAGQSRVITDYVSATDTATVDTWTTTPTGTITYVVFGTAPASTSAPIAANVTQWLGTAVATPTVAGVPEVDVTHNGGTAITAAAGIQEVKVASIAANAITAAATAADFGAEIADALLARNVAGGSDGTRTVSQAFYVLRNKVAISAGTLTVYGTDDSTPAFTASVTTAAGDPVSAIDPA